NGTTTNSNVPLDVPSFAALAVAKATLSTNALTAGAHTITASYAGDAGHTASLGTVSQSVTSRAPHDFSGDGKSDIAWRHSGDGDTSVWLMSGSTLVQGGGFGPVPPAFAIVGQRDFNGDGKHDWLFRNGSTGDIVLWTLNGLSTPAISFVGNV